MLARKAPFADLHSNLLPKCEEKLLKTSSASVHAHITLSPNHQSFTAVRDCPTSAESAVSSK
eukprot:717540-Pleurochrysis_carterae.AAC.1